MALRLFFILLTVSVLLHAQQDKLVDDIDQKADFYSRIAQQIWSQPELGYQEVNSSALLKQTLKNEGFKRKGWPVFQLHLLPNMVPERPLLLFWQNLTPFRVCRSRQFPTNRPWWTEVQDTPVAIIYLVRLL